jgi:hypothetical protein
MITGGSTPDGAEYTLKQFFSDETKAYTALFAYMDGEDGIRFTSASVLDVGVACGVSRVSAPAPLAAELHPIPYLSRPAKIQRKRFSLRQPSMRL